MGGLSFHFIPRCFCSLNFTNFIWVSCWHLDLWFYKGNYFFTYLFLFSGKQHWFSKNHIEWTVFDGIKIKKERRKESKDNGPDSALPEVWAKFLMLSLGTGLGSVYAAVLRIKLFFLLNNHVDTQEDCTLKGHIYASFRVF